MRSSRVLDHREAEPAYQACLLRRLCATTPQTGLFGCPNAQSAEDMHVSDPTQIIRELMPLAATMGIRADVYAPDQVVLSMDWAPALCTAGGILHGGAVMALADSAGGVCTILQLPEGPGGASAPASETPFRLPRTAATFSRSARFSSDESNDALRCPATIFFRRSGSVRSNAARASSGPAT